MTLPEQCNPRPDVLIEGPLNLETKLKHTKTNFRLKSLDCATLGWVDAGIGINVKQTRLPSWTLIRFNSTVRVSGYTETRLISLFDLEWYRIMQSNSTIRARYLSRTSCGGVMPLRSAYLHTLLINPRHDSLALIILSISHRLGR